MARKQTIILAVVLVVGVSLVWFFGLSKQKVGELSDNTPVPTPTATAEPSPVVFSPKPVASQQPDALNKYPPAECTLTGSITFIEAKLYENKDANIIYKNIDSIARLILWTITPQEDLSIGPNIFANLPLPDGTEDITLSLPE